MADTSDTSTDLAVSEQEPPAPKDSEKPPADKPKAKSGGGLLAAFCLFLLVALAGVGGWYGWQMWQQLQALQGQLSAGDAEPAAPFDPAPLERQLAELYEQINELRTGVRELGNAQPAIDVDLIDNMARELASVQNRLESLSDTTRDDWKLAEAAFLLRLANQKVLVEHNSAEALALTRAADDILKGQDDPNLFAIRQMLAREMTELKMIEPVDREGVYARLQSVIDEVADLPLLESFERDLPEASAGEAPSAEGGWETVKASLLHGARTLGSLIRVRDHDESIAPLMAPEEQWFLRQNLRLMLEQAQSALLREEPRLYHQSLAKAEQWLGDHFALNPQTQALLDTLGELQQVQVEVELPDISEAHNLLRQYLERLHQVEAGDRS